MVINLHIVIMGCDKKPKAKTKDESKRWMFLATSVHSNSNYPFFIESANCKKSCGKSGVGLVENFKLRRRMSFSGLSKSGWLSGWGLSPYCLRG